MKQKWENISDISLWWLPKICYNPKGLPANVAMNRVGERLRILTLQPLGGSFLDVMAAHRSTACAQTACWQALSNNIYTYSTLLFFAMGL